MLYKNLKYKAIQNLVSYVRVRIYMFIKTNCINGAELCLKYSSFNDNARLIAVFYACSYESPAIYFDFIKDS